MRKLQQLRKAFVLLIIMMAGLSSYSQTPTYTCVAMNDYQVNSKEYKFDIYIYQTGTTNFYLNNYQLSFKITNSAAILNGGTLSATFDAGSSELSTWAPNSTINIITVGGATYTKISGPAPSSCGILIPSSGLRVGTFRIKNTADFGQSSMGLIFWNAVPATSIIWSIDPPTSSCGSTKIITNFTNHTTNLTDPILNAAVKIFNMTGGGNYCPSGSGVDVCLDNSEDGVSYQLIKNGTPVGTPVAGTGGPICFGPQTAGTYTCTGTRDATYLPSATMNGSIVCTPGTPTPVITGNFSICSGAQGEIYTTSSGMTNYVWTVNGEISFTGQGTYSITVDWGTTPPADISVSYDDAGCPASSSVQNITFSSSASTAPTGVNATVNPVCSGSSTSLSVVGGSLGAGAVWTWYPGNCGGTSIGTGSPLLINPTVGATYFVRAEGSCNTTSCASLTVNIGSSLPASVSIAANPGGAICSGTSVTFTATPTNGGTTPTYQWKKNSVNVGTGATYTSNTLVNGDVITCIMTSNDPCATGSPATSTPITMTVSPSLTPGVTVTANPPGAICAGTSVTFTATPSNGGTTPTYQWKKNSVNVGTGATYTSNSLANGDVITCVMTSSSPCASPLTATSLPLTIVVSSNVTASVSITANPAAACPGANVTFTATPANGGTNPSYQWQVNGVNAGTNSATYSTTSLTNGDQITCIMTSNNPCVTVNPVTSSPVTMIIFPNVNASISVSASPNGTICSGTNVNFTATTSNGGSTPSYQWQVNGSNAGTNNSTFSSTTLANGNIVTCILTSNALCVQNSPITSNQVIMSVTPSQPVSVSISANPSGAVCANTNVVFTATPTNGGSVPAYQWQLNGTNINGATSATYSTTTLVTGDQITCILTSNGSCISGSPATSNIIPMTVNPSLPASVNIVSNPSGTVCSGFNVTFTANPTNGGTTPDYQWQLNGSNINGATLATYTSNSLTNGDIVTCVMTSGLACASGSPATSNPITMSLSPSIDLTVANAVTLSANPTGSVCPGDTITFTANIPVGLVSPAYQWTVDGTPVNGASNATFSGTSFINGNVISFIVSSNATCVIGSPATADNPFTVSVNPAVIPVSIIPANDTTICIYNNILLDAGVGYSQYLWSDINNTAGQYLIVDQSIVGLGSWPFIVEVSNAYGCKDKDTIVITMDACIGINEIGIDPIIKCYPNPTSDMLNISIEGIYGNAEASLINVYGQLIYEEQFSNCSGKIGKEVNMAVYSKGVYFLKIAAGNKIYNSKVIVD